MAHKCNMQQLFATPDSYENKHRPNETGRSVCINYDFNLSTHAFQSTDPKILTFMS